MNIDVLGLGAVAMDIVLNCGHLPEEDGYAVIDKESATPGGSCANVITSLAGFGTKSGFVARLGDDTYGRALMTDLQALGVATRYISVKKDGVSMHSYVAVEKSGSKTIFCNMGDSLLSLTEQEVHAEMLDGVKFFYTAMQPGKPALKLARLCREKGIPVICNLQVEPDFLNRCGVSKSMIEEMLSLSGLLITFRNGLITHTGQRDIHAAARYLYEKYHPDMGLIVTLGEDGALWLDGKSFFKVPAFHVAARDTTGAGDAFIGGIIQGKFFEGFDPKKAMVFASACAALKCTQPGPRLKASKSDVLNFMEGHETI
ncbi:MAG: carbohydrate kinase family protein [Proteobacteria bacterium]|nr:carbohydrate kinase family protein [Pseudomonadota bacterium]